MALPIETSETLTAAGGANDALVATAYVRTESAKVQVAVGGATTDANVFIEGRLTPAASFGVITSELTVKNGFNQLWTIDTDDLYELQVRVKNNDGVNGAESTAIVRTD